jgi:ABC-type lipoprotein release transport system permease subunit
MDKFSALVILGFKYLYRYRKRYGFLVAALVFSFGVVTFLTSSRDGMYDNLYYSAQSHYAGDIVAVGFNSETDVFHLGQDDISIILNAAMEAGLNPKYTVLRTLLGDRGVVHFNGNAVSQKYVVGCDWEREAHLFSKMIFESPPEQYIGDDAIILSSPVAQLLGAVMGDSVILETETMWGQKNSGRFIVRGIVQDSTLFGYFKVYISRLSLNRLLLFEDEDCSTVGFFLENPFAAEKNRQNLQTVLSEKMQMGPLVFDRDEMEWETSQPWSGTRVFLFTMAVYLSEISELLDAIYIITYFLFGLMLIIIFVSAAVTYRLLIHERVKEMGVMRSIGFYGGDLRLVLWTEVIALGIISLFAGFLFAWILNSAASLLSFTWFPSSEIFLKDGSLFALYLPKTILANAFLVFLVLALAVFFPSLRVSKKHLPTLLSGEPI